MLWPCVTYPFANRPSLRTQGGRSRDIKTNTRNGYETISALCRELPNKLGSRPGQDPRTGLAACTKKAARCRAAFSTDGQIELAHMSLAAYECRRNFSGLRALDKAANSILGFRSSHVCRWEQSVRISLRYSGVDAVRDCAGGKSSPMAQRKLARPFTSSVAQFVVQFGSDTHTQSRRRLCRRVPFDPLL